MDRRKFLQATAAASTVAFADGALAATEYFQPTRFALGYHSGLEDGYWMPARFRAFDEVHEKVRLMLLGVQSHSARRVVHPIRTFELELLYRVEGLHEGVAPYKWAVLTREGGELRMSKAISHELAPDAIAGVRVNYRMPMPRGEGVIEDFTETLSFLDAQVPMLTPGFYAIVGPSAKTMNPPPWGTIASPGSGGKALSLKSGAEADFDAVLIAVEPA